MTGVMTYQHPQPKPFEAIPLTRAELGNALKWLVDNGETLFQVSHNRFRLVGWPEVRLDAGYYLARSDRKFFTMSPKQMEGADCLGGQGYFQERQ